LLAVCQSFRPQIVAISHQQVECEKARLTAMKQQVTEPRPPALIQTHDFAVQHCFACAWRFQLFAQRFK
jgi:hypothetical protein